MLCTTDRSDQWHNTDALLSIGEVNPCGVPSKVLFGLASDWPQVVDLSNALGVLHEES